MNARRYMRWMCSGCEAATLKNRRLLKQEFERLHGKEALLRGQYDWHPPTDPWKSGDAINLFHPKPGTPTELLEELFAETPENTAEANELPKQERKGNASPQGTQDSRAGKLHRPK